MLISLKLIDQLFLQLPFRTGADAKDSPCWQRWDLGLFAEVFTRQGFEVESQTLRGSGFEKVVVGKITAAERHPKADKLQVCQVQTGPNDVRQIVCGAANARTGLYVAVALPGAVLPNGLEIKTSKIRDVESSGMLCSREELGLPVDEERDGSGIWELHHEPSCGLPETELQARLGQPVFNALGLDDVIFELNVTPNRPDLLGHEGAARELCAGLNWTAKTKLELKAWRTDWKSSVSAGQLLAEAQERHELKTKVGTFSALNELGAPAFFVALDNVRVTTTPAWIRNCLESLGQKSVNAVVDAGNLILLCFAQPNHAFDLAKLNPSTAGQRQLTLRFAREGEAFQGLDGKERVLVAHDCVVADATTPQALLGVIGGEKSKVTGESTSLVLEFANPHPVLVRRASRRHGRKTDSSFAFEKGIDVFRRCEAAEKLIGLISALQNSATGTALNYCGSIAARQAASLAHESSSYFPSAADAVKQLDAMYSRVEADFSIHYGVEDLPARVGTSLVSFIEQLSILRSLGFVVSDSSSGHSARVVVPSWRRLDVVGVADLVEEIVRVVGIDHVPAQPMTNSRRVASDDAHLSFFESTANRLVSLGYHETAGFHFMRADDWKKLNQTHLNSSGEPVALINPIIKDEPLMQTTLLSGLLRKVAFNLNYGNRRGQLFELSRTFQNADMCGSRVFPDNGVGVSLAEQLAERVSSPLYEYASSECLLLSREETARERPAETPRVCGVVFGVEEEKEWLNSTERVWTLHRLAAHVAELMSVYEIKTEIVSLPADHPLRPALHPGRCAHIVARIATRIVPLGWVAEFHPSALRNFEIGGHCLGFEINLATALKVHFELKEHLQNGERKMRSQAASHIRLPTVERDFAFLVVESLPAEALVSSVRAAIETDAIEVSKIPARLVAVSIFDIYRGQGVAAGHKSFAVRVTLLPVERTLTDADIQGVTQAVVARVTRDCSAQLRG